MKEHKDFFTVYQHFVFGMHRGSFLWEGEEVGHTAGEISCYVAAHSAHETIILRGEQITIQLSDPRAKEEFMLALQKHMDVWHFYFIVNNRADPYDDTNWPDEGKTIRELGVVEDA